MGIRVTLTWSKVEEGDLHTIWLRVSSRCSERWCCCPGGARQARIGIDAHRSLDLRRRLWDRRKPFLRGWAPAHVAERRILGAGGRRAVSDLTVGVWSVRRGCERADRHDTQLHGFGMGLPLEHERLSDVRHPGREPGERLLPAASRGHEPLRVHPDRVDSPAGLGRSPRRRRSSRSRARWYHLTGVYDSVEETFLLYVNGTLQQTQWFVPNWQASGPFCRRPRLLQRQPRRTRLREDRRRPVPQRRRRRPDDLAARGARRAHGRRLAGGPGDQPNAVRRVPGGDQPLGRRRPVRGTDP